MNKSYLFSSFFFFLFCTGSVKSQSLYFPPLTGSNWDTVSPATLGWCQPAIDTLLSFLQQKNTKAFIVLKDGKIAIEQYYGTFTADSFWYWASAGKTLTSFLTGIANEEGLLSLTDSTSKYLGNGWTSCSGADEALITIKNQLTMTTGLNDSNSTNDCTVDSCLFCIAAPLTRWAYHNAPYTLLHPVIENASGNTINNFTQSRVLAKTGMSGFWYTIDFDDVFFSKARSMARFGLLSLNRGIWNNDTLLHDTAFINAMTNTSQNLNLSYGYLWWLNGKSSFMLPGSQFVFNGSLIPAAPADLFAALGKNDQKIHVVPSMNLVVVRMGDAADTSLAAPTSFDNDLWLKLNDVFCNQTGVNDPIYLTSENPYPNPIVDWLNLEKFVRYNFNSIKVFNQLGQVVYESPFSGQINLARLKNGLYFLNLINNNTGANFKSKILKTNEN